MVESGGLENRYGGNFIEGSNPSFSAYKIPLTDRVTLVISHTVQDCHIIIPISINNAKPAPMDLKERRFVLFLLKGRHLKLLITFKSVKNT